MLIARNESGDKRREGCFYVVFGMRRRRIAVQLIENILNKES